MADIAILVAEEYQRRVKNSSKSSGGEGGEVDLLCGGAVVAERLMKLSKAVCEGTMEIVRGSLEPKSELGLAAIAGFFSA
ncbi:hypothetical protein Nepgr_022438 [Nepenthes gracilis]|uniref:Uncharacterized protein n=1 Tax=Nepenthes gracilis TaxID=150966 RepID=A0AAD3T227_NEPGR|nr:hypothetical protein Nepgr_022438 [Nepenthes gracilis]